MIRKSPKRDALFLKTLKTLPYINDPLFNILQFDNFDEGKFLSCPWRSVIRHTFEDARRSLFYAHTNQLQSTYKRKRKNLKGEITVDPLIIEKAYYFRYFCIMLTACGDKLANYLREYFKIEKWGEEKAHIKNTTLPKVCKYLDDNNDDNNKVQFSLKRILHSYLSDDNVYKIIEIGKKIKHRWPDYYHGEGVKSEKPSERDETDSSGRKQKVFEVGASYPAKILGDDIEAGRRALNAFADVCTQVENILSPEGPYPHCIVGFSNW